MKKVYYVIVDLDDLTYMTNGRGEKDIINADKFESYIDARKELEEYDKDFNGAIYEIIEHVDRQIKLIKKSGG